MTNMNTTNRMPGNEGEPAPTSANPQQWIVGLHQQFMTIATAGEEQVIALYHSAVTVEQVMSHNQGVRQRAHMAADAAKARMHALVGKAGSVPERRRLRNNFLEVTHDGSFQWFWPWG
jgi:hypothetical protein